MKPILTLSLLACTVFYGCSNLESTRTATVIKATTSAPILSLVDTAETVQILPQEYVNELGKYPKLISPNGEKIAIKFPIMEVNKQTFLVFPIISINAKNAATNNKIQLDRTSTLYSFDSWSPDNTAFAGIFYDVKKFNGAETCCGEAIAVTNIVDEKAQTFIYSWNWNEASIISWSNDSSKIGITFPFEHNAMIIDRYGNLIKTLNSGEKIFFWSENLLYFTAKKGGKVELHTLDWNTQKSDLVLDDLNNLYYVAHNDELGQILLTERIRKQNDTLSIMNNFYVLDTSSRAIEKIATPNSKETSVFPWVSSLSQDYVALKGEDNSLWIFDWSIHKLKDYGQIKDLFGWFENANGFLITSLNGEQKIIKP
jgi:hypothetical protein